jgi:hypothetical protein
MAATFKSINSLLKDIIIKVSLRIEEEKKIMDRIRKIKAENDNFRSSILQEQQLQDPVMQQLQDPVMQQLQQYEPQPQLPSLQAIQSICSNVISRINILREYVTEITRISESLYRITPKVSVKDYISRCSNEDMKKCYDDLNTKLHAILKKNLPQKQLEQLEQLEQLKQLTIFKKGYLLYDLIRTKNKDEFRRMLTDERTKYSESRNEPLIGGANSTLLQVIGLTKIIAILSYLHDEYNIITSTDKSIQPMQLQEYKQYVLNGKDSQGVNIFYLLNDEQERTTTGELTAEDCLRIYKNGEIINTIVSFFYTELIIPPPIIPQQP